MVNYKGGEENTKPNPKMLPKQDWRKHTPQPKRINYNELDKTKNK